MNYKHIIFDFGNVLATFQSDDLLRSYCNREDLPILKDACLLYTSPSPRDS